MTRPLPPANALTKAQYDGHACVWCGKKLWSGAVSAGRAKWTGGILGDIEVYACPDCAPRSPADGAVQPPTLRDEDGQAL